jgi:hypothetical protein
MKIEIGKYYRLRDGTTVGPMSRDPYSSEYPWSANGQCWMEAGQFLVDYSDHASDIVALSPPSTALPSTALPSAPSDAADKWSTVAMCIGMFAEIAHAESVARGWYHDPTTGEPIQRNIGEMMALVHSEVSEALEGDRKLKPDDHLPALPSTLVELADAFIRLGDLAIYLCELDRYKSRFGTEAMDIGRAVAEKMAYNATRADHSLEARKAAGGKAY